MKILKLFFNGLISPYLLIKEHINKCTKDANVYKYIALNNDKTKETDYLCINENIINNFLITENKKLLSIKTNKLIKYKYRYINRKRLSNKELVYFLVQVNTFLKAGNSLIASISLVIKKCKYKNLERILRMVRYDLMCGNDLSDSLKMQGNSFPKLLIEVLKNKSINDINHLKEMEEYYKNLYLNDINNTKLSLYKVFIVPYMLMVTMFILGYIIPKFYALYKMFLNEELLFLKGFIRFSKYDNIVFIMFISLIIIYTIIILLYNIKSIKIKLQYLKMKFLNNTINTQMVIYSKTLSLIIKYNIYDLNVIENITDNYYYNELIKESVTLYKNEKVLSPILKNKIYFSKKALEMIQLGEKFDSLLLQINNINNLYQNKIDKNKKETMNIIGPIIIIESTLLFGSIVIILLFQCLLLIK